MCCCSFGFIRSLASCRGLSFVRGLCCFWFDTKRGLKAFKVAAALRYPPRQAIQSLPVMKVPWWKDAIGIEGNLILSYPKGKGGTGNEGGVDQECTIDGWCVSKEGVVFVTDWGCRLWFGTGGKKKSLPISYYYFLMTTLFCTLFSCLPPTPYLPTGIGKFTEMQSRSRSGSHHQED